MASTVIQIVILLWLLALGGAIGSFLNVLVYRLPLGMSLVEPRSHCPHCKHTIRWHDNLPVVGWLLLGGRCRDCQAAISARYPTVEAMAAGLFVVLGTIEWLTWGGNLPARPVMTADGVIYPSLDIGQLVGILVYHLALVSTLLAAALLEYDGHKAPWRLTLPVLVAGSLAPLVWPDLHPVAAWPGPDGWVAGLADVAAGLIVGVVWGVVVEWLIQGKAGWGCVAVWACVGLVLGWQATVVVGIASTALYPLVLALGLVWPDKKKPGWLAGLTLSVVTWVLLWAPVTNQWPILK